MDNKSKIKDLQIYGFIHSFFKNELSKPQRDTLAKAIVGIVTNWTSTFTSMENILWIFTNSKDKSNFYRFLQNNDVKWLKTKLIEHITKRYLSENPNVEIYLIIDDTLIEEYWDSMEWVWYHYSHTEWRNIRWRSIVSLIIKIWEVKYPIISRIYYKKEDAEKIWIEFKTKIELVSQMLDEFKQTYQGLFERRRITVLWDSWYSAWKLLEYIDKIWYYFIFRAKKNRNVKVRWRKIGIKEALKEKNKVKWKVKDIEKEVYFYRWDIKDLSLMEWEYIWEWYLISNIDLDAEEAAKKYSIRWNIEIWYKEMKQYLWLNSWSIRDRKIVKKWINLLEIVYLYLVYEQIKEKVEHIKEVILEIKRRITFRIMSILTTLLKAGYSLKTAFLKLINKKFAKL